MSIEVDLDQEPPPVGPASWLDHHPKQVAFGALAAGVVAVAIVAVTVGALRAAPAPAVLPTPSVVAGLCSAGLAMTPPLPAFTITDAVKGDLYSYEDTGRWTWLQMIWIPAAFGSQPDLGLVELQTGSVRWPRITIATAGPNELAIRLYDTKSAVAVKRLVSFAPPAVYDRWAMLRVSSADMPSGDEVTFAVTDTEGAATSATAPVADDFHGPMTGFGLLAPAGALVDVLPGPQVKYGPPSFTATC